MRITKVNEVVVVTADKKIQCSHITMNDRSIVSIQFFQCPLDTAEMQQRIAQANLAFGNHALKRVAGDYIVLDDHIKGKPI